LIDNGVRLFRINGAYFQCNEYNKLINTLQEIFQKKTNDRFTIIFDLKGPIPRITKIGNKKNHIDVKKDQIIKIVHENPKIDDEDVIQVDRKIIECIKVGDRIVVDSSKCVLKVISMDRYKRKNSINKMPGHKSSHKLANTLDKLDFGCYLDDTGGDIEIPEFEFQCPKNSNLNIDISLPIIEEKDELKIEDDFHINDNLDLTMEERLKQRQSKIKQDYLSIIRKHRHYNDFNRINEIESLRSEHLSPDDSDSNINSRKYFLFLFFLINFFKMCNITFFPIKNAIFF
jgi:hypothetical protein